MSHESMIHTTRTFDRSFRAPLARLYAAWTSAEARAAWGSPDPSIVIRMRAADFRVGGEDVSDCVMDGVAVATVRSCWLDIEPERRVVYTETIAEGETVQGVSLVSAELRAEGSGSRMILTLQTVAFDGSGLEKGVIDGWTAGLDSLATWLDG